MVKRFDKFGNYVEMGGSSGAVRKGFFEKNVGTVRYVGLTARSVAPWIGYWFIASIITLLIYSVMALGSLAYKAGVIDNAQFSDNSEIYKAATSKKKTDKEALRKMILEYQNSGGMAQIEKMLSAEGVKRFMPFIIMLAVYLLYMAIMESSAKQATLGKIMIGAKVTDKNGQRIGFLCAVLRNLLKPLSLISVIGILMIGLTGRKRALHDLICGTFVVRTAL